MCRHWKLTDDTDPKYPQEAPVSGLLVRDPVEYEPVDPQPFELRGCFSPKVRFYERPEVDGAAILDGSAYQGFLVTGPEFGCTAWEAVTSEISTCAN